MRLAASILVSIVLAGSAHAQSCYGGGSFSFNYSNGYGYGMPQQPYFPQQYQYYYPQQPYYQQAYPNYGIGSPYPGNNFYLGMPPGIYR